VTGIPAKIGKYDVIEPISRAGSGTVYKASDAALGDSVLIKLWQGFPGADRAALERFYSQAALEARLQHPNILAVRDFGQQDGSPYIVWEYVDGESLDRIIESGRPIPVSEKIGYIIEVCHALSYVHREGIVHRNIKSAKVMILKMGGVKIFDFSMACIEDEHAQTPSRPGQIVGTLTHMSPEQIRGEVVDARSDIFSTGVVLYELLTGSLPFQGLSTADILMRILNDPPCPFPASLGSYAARLQEITFRALAKERRLRYQTSEDLAFDLGEVRELIAA
jgi:serine/threonine protein kinase